MFIPDGSDIDYSKDQIPGRYSWGWIGNQIPPENCGWTDRKLKEAVVARLTEIMSATKVKEFYGKKFVMQIYCTDQHCGWHDCEICRKPDEREYELGWNGSILIVHNNKEYRAPWAVIHYIKRHDYRPPSEAIHALFHGRIRTYDEVNEERILESRRRLKERMAKEEAERKETERKKTPEQKEKDRLRKEYLALCEQKVKALRESGAMIN